VASAARATKSNEAKDAEWEYEGSNPAAASPSSQPESVATVNDPRIPESRSDSLSADRNSRFPVSSPFSLNAYRAIVVGGRIDWSAQWVKRLIDYVESGGTVVLNSAQTKGISAELLGVHSAGVTAEADNARCLSPGEAAQNLNGQVFRYERVEMKGAQPLMIADNGDPLVTVNKVGKGAIVFSALPDWLGEDERITPFAAHMLAHVFADATPIKVNGDVEYLVNRTEVGWVVTLFNNQGVYKPQQGLARVERAAIVTAGINLRGGRIARARDWISDRSLEVTKQPGTVDSITISIAPGGIAIVEIQ